MLKRLDRPVRIVFFHDPMMRETVELYQLIAAQSPRITVEFYDPMINPAQARMLGVNFAGTAVMESEGRRLQVNGGSETDIANGILRVSQSATQRVCFLDGHGEPDPFSLESHDHLEGAPGHSHGLGAKYVLHERHGMAKARHALETLNYTVEKVLAAAARRTALAGCAVLVVAGPKVPLLPAEVDAIGAYLAAGGNALFMLDPFVAHRARAGAPGVRHRGGRRHRHRRGEPLLGRRLRARGQRLQPPPDHPRSAAGLLPRRALALADPAAGARHLGGPARQLVARTAGRRPARIASASSRAATSRARAR